MAPQPGKPQPADTERSQIGYGDRVKVLVVPWQDSRSGHEGTVKRVRLEAGELLVTVEFADRTRHEYGEGELRRTTLAHTRSQRHQPDW